MNYRFEDFELNVACMELRRGGRSVRVEPQVFELLHLLVSSSGRLVTRDEIHQRIWGQRIVSEAALSTRLRDARKAIGDDGTAQRLIRTVPRRGLRFLGVLADPADDAEANPTIPVAAALNSETSRDSFRPAVAVRPFEDASENGQPILSDVLTDELAAAISAWHYFPVASRATARLFDEGGPSAVRIARSTGVRYLLTGSVRRVGARIKIIAVLTDVEEDCLIWTAPLSRDLNELVDVEEEIAAHIAKLIVPELQGAEARRSLRRAAADLNAWELAMRAAWLIGQGAAADFTEAERLAMLSAKQAPDWALPLALIATTRFQRAMQGFSRANSATVFSGALAAARAALDIDRSLWLAHALSAVGELWTNRNYDRALLHVTRAIELNPSASMNYHFGGCICGFSGDLVSARKHQERLFRIDPVYPYAAVIEADLGLWYMLDGDFAAAELRLSRSMAWDDEYGRALQRRISLAGHQGDKYAAQSAARKLRALNMSLEPKAILESYPFRRNEHGEMFLEGLRRSGVTA